MARGKTEKRHGGANLGFEATLWAAADKLRGHMDAAIVWHIELFKGSLTLANSKRPRGHGRQMNLAIRGIEADLGDENADSFHRDLQDFVIG